MQLLVGNNLQDVPQWELDWLKGLPTAWDDVKFIAGYPTKYAVVARKASQENGSGAAINNGKWIVGGLNRQAAHPDPQSAYVRWQDCGISYRPAKETG